MLPTEKSPTAANTMLDQPEPSESSKKKWEDIKSGIDTCKTYRNKLAKNWSLNVDYRRGKPFSAQDDDDAIAVPLDWSYTKTKQAALFSQVPAARAVHSPELLNLPWVPTFERKLNDVLKPAGIEAAMEQCIPDCVNAAGFAAVICYYEAITEDREIPAMDLSLLPPVFQQEVATKGTINGRPIEMQTVPVTVDKRYVIQRISPVDFLWPIEFNGADFNTAPWLGRTHRITWAEAARKWGLSEAEKEKLLADETQSLDRLTPDTDRDQARSENKVGFDEIFYKEYVYHEDSKSYSAIRHLVFLHGKKDPVINEPWKGQEFDEESGLLIGSMKNPIQVITLTYLTDEAIPPSDSAIGRSQVNEINRGRTLQIRQRSRSLPIRWFDSNRLDPAIQGALLRGSWQHMIPVQGEGSRIVGEIQRAPFHPENFSFDTIAKNDLQETWSTGANQMGSGADVETKGESNNLQTNYSTKISRERAKVASFFTNICEVIGGLMCLYEDPAEFGEGFTPLFSRSLQFSILPDSTVLIDSNQRLERINNFVNTYLKTGWINPEPVLKEVATLIGLDPNTVIMKPQPQQPDLPNISLRLTGSDDLLNPLVLAFMVKTGQAPSPELIEQAKQLIQQAVVAPPPAPAQPAPPPGTPMPEPTPPRIGEANPQATILPTITKRSDDPSGVQ
jgi:hypothetical protein